MPQIRDAKAAPAQPNIQDVFSITCARKLAVRIRLMDGSEFEGG
jgi:hypothetical protein